MGVVADRHGGVVLLLFILSKHFTVWLRPKAALGASVVVPFIALSSSAGSLVVNPGINPGDPWM